MENLIEVDENWGYPYDLGNLHVMIEKDQGQNMWLGNWLLPPWWDVLGYTPVQKQRIPSNFEACEEWTSRPRMNRKSEHGKIWIFGPFWMASLGVQLLGCSDEWSGVDFLRQMKIRTLDWQHLILYKKGSWKVRPFILRGFSPSISQMLSCSKDLWRSRTWTDIYGRLVCIPEKYAHHLDNA